MRDGEIGDLVVCVIVAIMAVYWIYSTFAGIGHGAGSRAEYYESSAR